MQLKFLKFLKYMTTQINVPPAVNYLMLKKAYAYRLLKWKGFSLPDFEQLV